MRCAIPLFAIALLLSAGCVQQISPSRQPTDYSYDLAIKDIATLPRTVYIGDNYTLRVVVQIYGRHLPFAYHLSVTDGNSTICDEDVRNPGPIRSFDFNYTKAGEEPRNIRAYVRSIDPLHPEPAPSLPNNLMGKTIRPQPLGYYGACDACMHLYYDAVNYVMRQAQAFTLLHEFEVRRIGLYLRAPIPNSNESRLLVALHNDSGGKPGIPVALSCINAWEIGPEPGWHYAHFQNLTLAPGKYWIVAMMNDTSGYGAQWARSEGNPYGEAYDTMVMDMADWPEWDYKLFDFVFQIY